MKHLNAVILSFCAGIATFTAQHYLFPAQLHAAHLVVPHSADWRQQMIDRDPGGQIVDRKLQDLAERLDLTSVQTAKLRPVLEESHERILSVLLTAPPSLTREQFVSKRQAIRERTHNEVESLLTSEQRGIERSFQRPSNS